MKKKKFTKEELEQMIGSNDFCYGTPIRAAAIKNAEDYDFDNDTLDVVECVEDAFVYGAIWVMEHLQ